MRTTPPLPRIQEVYTYIYVMTEHEHVVSEVKTEVEPDLESRAQIRPLSR